MTSHFLPMVFGSLSAKNIPHARASHRSLWRCPAAWRLQSCIRLPTPTSVRCPNLSPPKALKQKHWAQTLSTQRPSSIMDQASLVNRVLNRSSDKRGASPRFVVISCDPAVFQESGQTIPRWHCPNMLTYWKKPPLNLPTIF